MNPGSTELYLQFISSSFLSWDRVMLNCSKWPLTWDSLASSSQEDEMIGMYYHTWPFIFYNTIYTLTNLFLPWKYVRFTPSQKKSLPSSMAFLTARSPSLTASLIRVRVCLFGPLINKVTERGLTQSSIKVNFSSP